MSGLTAFGFERKRLADIKADIEASLKTAFGNNIDLSPQSVFGQFIGIMSERISEHWESQENIYNSQYPSTAQGNQLSNVVLYNGIERRSAEYSTATVTLTGVNGTVITQGSQVAVSGTEEVFVIDEDATIVGGTASVGVTAQETGPIEAVAGSITVILTPIFGWTGVTNPLDAAVGSDEETDAELRERRTLSTQALGQNLIDSLYGQLLNLDNVEDAIVIDNKTAAPADGIPAYQFLVSILGGDDAEIAETIWKNTPQGIASFGTTTVVHTDDQGFPQDVKFTRPSDVEIYFKVDITTDSSFPGTGSTDIKNAIVEYGQENFKISDDVIRTKFYTPINTVPGITSIDLRIGLSASPTGTANLTIDLDEVSRYDTSRVEVNIV